MSIKNTNTMIIENMKKLLAKLMIFAMFFHIFNVSLFLSDSVFAEKISEHRVIGTKSAKQSLIYGNTRLKNYIITTSSGVAQKLPLGNPYNIDIQKLDLSISSTLSGTVFSTGEVWKNDSILIDNFDIYSSTGVLFKTNLTSYQTGEIRVDYELSETGNLFLYTGSFMIPFENFAPVSGGDTFSSLLSLNNIQISKYISTGPTSSIQLLQTETGSGSETGSGTGEKIGKLEVMMSGSHLLGVDKISDEIYVNLKSLSGDIMVSNGTTQLKVITKTVNDKVSLNKQVWYDELRVSISSGSSQSPAIYFKSSSSGNKEIEIKSENGRYEATNLSSLEVKNKIDIHTQNKKVIKGELSSKIGFRLTDPRKSKQSQAIGSIKYSGNPLDGDTLTIDKVTYEFDNNGVVTNGNVLVGITDTAGATFTKLRDLINNGGVPSVYSTLLLDTRTLYVEARESGYKGNTIKLEKSGTNIQLDGNTLGNTQSGNGELVYVNKPTLLKLETIGGIVSLSKSNIESVTGILLNAGETMGEFYFIADNVSGSGEVKISYIENGLEWLSSIQEIEIEEPRVGFVGEEQIGKVNTPIELQIGLRDLTGVSSYVSRGDNGVRLSSNSVGGKFSLTSNGVYSSSLIVNYGSGESMKTIWYKDENESVLGNQISQTQIRAEIQKDTSQFGTIGINIYSDTQDNNANTAYVKSVNNKQFNAGNKGAYLSTGPKAFLTMSENNGGENTGSGSENGGGEETGSGSETGSGTGEKIGKLEVMMSGSHLLGVDKISDEIYVNLKSLSGDIMVSNGTTQLKVITKTVNDKVSLNKQVWYDELRVSISSGSSQSPAIYFKSSSSGNKEIEIKSENGRYEATNLSSLEVKNKIDIHTQNKKVIKGELSSKIGFRLTDPRKSKQSQAIGSIKYSGNPLDGDTLTIDKVTYEFDNNGVVTNGNVLVGITDTAGATFTKLRDLINNGGVPSVYSTLLLDTRTLYVEARESGYKGNTIKLEKSGTNIQLDGNTLGNTQSGNGELVYVNKPTLLKLETIGGIVSLSKSNIESVTGILLNAGETMGEFYFIADNVSGSGEVKISYIENGLEWLSSIQEIEIEEPRVGFVGEEQIGKVNTPIELQIGLRDLTGVSSYVSRGDNGVRLSSNSVGGKFSLTSNGVYSSSLIVNYGSGESMKTIWYKDENESILSGGLSQTVLKIENLKNSSEKIEDSIFIYNSVINNYYYNNAGVKGIQFNKGNNRKGIFIENRPSIDGTNLEAYILNNRICNFTSFFIQTACALEHDFDATNGGIKVYKMRTTEALDSFLPENIKTSGNELPPSEYQNIKYIDSATVEVYTQTGGENSLYLYEYTIFGVNNDIKEIKHYNYGFSTSSGNVFAVWNGVSWEQIGENNDDTLVGIPTIAHMNINLNQYISGNKLYILSSSKDISTFEKNISLYLDYAKLKVIDNKAPQITITSINDGFYKGDKKIHYSLQDNDGDSVFVDLEYSLDNGGTWQKASIESSTSDYKINNYSNSFRQSKVKTSFTGVDGVIVWRSITDLPYANAVDVKIRLSVKDKYELGNIYESDILVDNIEKWEVNSSPVIVVPGEAYKVEFIKPAIYNADNTFVKITSQVVDQFENHILGEIGKLSFSDDEGNTLTGVIDNNDGTYSLEIPVKTVVSQIDLFNFEKGSINKVNARKLVLAGQTISNGYLDILLNGNKLNMDNSVYSGDDGNFSVMSDIILTYGTHNLKLKVTPAGGGLETSNIEIEVVHNNINGEENRNKDMISIATEGTVGEAEYILQVLSEKQPISIIPFNSDKIYTTHYPTIVGRSVPNSLLNIYSGSHLISKVITDKYGIFEYNSVHKLENGAYNYTFENTNTSYTFDFIIDTNSESQSLEITNIFSNTNVNLESILIKGYGKKDSVLDVLMYQSGSYNKIGNTVIDKNGLFEYNIPQLNDGFYRLKFTNKSTGLNKYISFMNNKGGNCNIIECYELTTIGITPDNYISLQGYSKGTQFNKSALYIYVRGVNQLESENKLLGSMSTNQAGKISFHSLEKFSQGEYIITLASSFSNMKKEYYINTLYPSDIYMYEILAFGNELNFKGFIKDRVEEFTYKEVDLDTINSISYDDFLTGSLRLNNNGYFNENIYTHFTGSVIIKIDNGNNTYIKVIKK
ncbi:MAG: hypothetical protein AB7E37_02970 [Candidatus Altimarinota bacterium]